MGNVTGPFIEGSAHRLECPFLAKTKFVGARAKNFLTQVTRLLEIAAAMSSAQEKVTGSGKLDLGGVMAALAMANKQEGGRGGGAGCAWRGCARWTGGEGRREPVQAEVT